jgi:CRISPR/Cas system-associated protein Cas5 (RAMP superfamily)
MKFFSKIDKGDIDVLYADLYNNPEYINADEDTRKVLKEKYDKTIKEDLLFYSFNERGVLSELEDNPEIKAQIANPDFVLT